MKCSDEGKTEYLKPRRDISVGILAGGKSSRMGKNKALLTFENERIIERTARELSGFAATVISAADKGEYEDLGCRVVYDEHRDIGPIEGIRRVLAEAGTDYVFVCAADMPFVKKELVEYIASFISSDFDCFVIADEEHVHPLCAIYSKAVLPLIDELIEKGCYRLMGILNGSRTKYISLELSCFDKKVVKNINTKQEYAALSKPAVFCVSGYSDCGKTGLIVRLINEFIAQGLSVAVLKHDGHDSFSDLPGSDSERYGRAGAEMSAVFSDTRYMVHAKKSISAEDFLAFIRGAEDPPDAVILEGLKASKYPKVEVLRGGIAEESTCDSDTLICIAAEGLSPETSERLREKCKVFEQEDVPGIFLCIKEYFGME